MLMTYLRLDFEKRFDSLDFHLHFVVVVAPLSKEVELDAEIH